MSPAEGLPAGIRLRGQTKICRERPRFSISLQKNGRGAAPFSRASAGRSPAKTENGGAAVSRERLHFSFSLPKMGRDITGCPGPGKRLGSEHNQRTREAGQVSELNKRTWKAIPISCLGK